MTESPRVVVRGEAVAEVPPDAAEPDSFDSTRSSGSVASVATRVPLEDVGAAGELAVAIAALPDTSLHGPQRRLSRDHPAHQRVRADALADAVDRVTAYAAAPGCRLTGLVEVRDAGAGGGPGMRVTSFSLTTPAPHLDLQPAPQEVYGSVEVTFTMSEPDQKVFAL